MKRERRVIRISEADWSPLGHGRELPDKVLDEMYARLLALGIKVPIPAPAGAGEWKEWYNRVARFVLGRILISGFDISPALADPAGNNPFKKIRKGGPKGNFTDAEIAEAIHLVDSRPAGWTMAKAVEPIVHRKAARRADWTAIAKSLLAAVDRRRFPRHR